MAVISSIKLPNNSEYDLYAKTAGDAATVNNHNVNADVPSDAVFTDHYVTQSASTGAGWRKILLGSNAGSMDEEISTVTSNAFSSIGVEVKPSINQLKAASYNVAGHAVISYDSTEDAIMFTFT